MVGSTQDNTLLIILVILLSMTFAYSLLLMIGGGNLYKRARKGSTTAYLPIINLFSLLEIADMSTFFGILFFLPGINIIVISIAFFRLGKVFNTKMGFRIGLLFFPLCFYPLLAFGNKPYKVSDEEYFKALDNAHGESRNLMTDEEIRKEASEYVDDTPQVDSIFKTELQMMEEVAPYKAAKIDVIGLEKLKAATPEEDMFKPIGPAEFVAMEPTGEDMQDKKESKFTSELEKDDDVEYIDL